MKVIGVSGMPGSGKNFVSKIAQDNSIRVVKMGDIVREESEKRKEETGITAVNLRKEQGNFVLAKLTIEKIKEIQNSNQDLKSNTEENKKSIFIIEGIRSPFEIDMFKKSFQDFTLVSVFSSPATRFNRLKNRKRADDSPDYNDFLKRDQRELDFGLGAVIANSDYIILNESGIEEYKTQINEFFNNILNNH